MITSGGNRNPANADRGGRTERRRFESFTVQACPTRERPMQRTLYAHLIIWWTRCADSRRWRDDRAAAAPIHRFQRSDLGYRICRDDAHYRALRPVGRGSADMPMSGFRRTSSLWRRVGYLDRSDSDHSDHDQADSDRYENGPHQAGSSAGLRPVRGSRPPSGSPEWLGLQYQVEQDTDLTDGEQPEPAPPVGVTVVGVTEHEQEGSDPGDRRSGVQRFPHDVGGPPCGLVVGADPYRCG
jgi:hypothetical protein